MTAGGGAQRLDRWLWCVRLFRTRQAAAAFVEEHGARITRNGRVHRVEKPGFSLKNGDEIAFMLGDRLIVVRVVSFSERRLPQTEAAALMERIGGV